jgi:hypothetical protein
VGQLAQRVDDGQSLDAGLRFLHFGGFITPLLLHCFASVFDRFLSHVVLILNVISMTAGSHLKIVQK